MQPRAEAPQKPGLARYRQRNKIENTFACLKGRRRIATRYGPLRESVPRSLCARR
ncbi:hypothetical protein FGD77_13425 [Roseovarius sp. M141]|nr:hypothetical protein [Roseovarius sp. M141]